MVLFYNPISSANKKPLLPFSLLALASMLPDEEFQIVDGNLEEDPLATLTAIISGGGIRILAVTVMPGPQLYDAVPVCKALKAQFPELTVVWGGYFPTQHYDVVLKSSYVDLVLRGHGEFGFLRLVEEVRRGNLEAADAPGLARALPGEGVVAGSLPPLPDPEELPEYPYRKIPLQRYVRQTFLGPTLSHHSSYGCPFLCNFCAVVNLAEGRWKAQSARRTAATVEYLIENCSVRGIEFFDNNFFVSEARVLEFAERIERLGIRWWGEARIDTLLRYSDRTWDTMARSGLHMVFMGAESGSDRVLQLMNKGGTATADKTLAIAEKMRSYGIVPEFSFMVGNPPDPEADTAATLDFIRKVKKVSPEAEIVLYLYTPVPLEGNLLENAHHTGFRFPESLEEWTSAEWSQFSLRRSQSLPWMNPSLIRRVRNFESVLNAYYPTSTDFRLTPVKKGLLRLASGWRYHLNFHSYPLELRLLQSLFEYRRPETSGF